MRFLKTYLTLDENTAPWWEDPITDIVQLHNGNIACSGESSADVNIWCPNTGSLVKEIKFSQDFCINRMAILKNGMLACGGTDGSLTVCNPTTGLIVCILGGHDRCIESLTTLSDGSLVSYSHYGNIKIWNSLTGQLIKNVEADFTDTFAGKIEGELAVLSNDHFVLTRNRGPIWNRKECKWNQELGFDIGKYFKCSNNKLYGVDENGLLYSLNSQLGKTIISRKTASENERITEMAALDEERTITGYDNGLVRIWKKNSHVTIDLFADGLNIDNIFVMRDGRIITFAETKGKIWRI